MRSACSPSRSSQASQIWMRERRHASAVARKRTGVRDRDLWPHRLHHPPLRRVHASIYVLLGTQTCPSQMSVILVSPSSVPGVSCRDALRHGSSSGFPGLFSSPGVWGGCPLLACVSFPRPVRAGASAAAPRAPGGGGRLEAAKRTKSYRTSQESVMCGNFL